MIRCKEKKEASGVSGRFLASIPERMRPCINELTATERGTFSMGQAALSRNTNS